MLTHEAVAIDTLRESIWIKYSDAFEIESEQMVRWDQVEVGFESQSKMNVVRTSIL